MHEITDETEVNWHESSGSGGAERLGVGREARDGQQKVQKSSAGTGLAAREGRSHWRREVGGVVRKVRKWSTGSQAFGRVLGGEGVVQLGCTGGVHWGCGKVSRRILAFPRAGGEGHQAHQAPSSPRSKPSGMRKPWEWPIRAAITRRAGSYGACWACCWAILQGSHPFQAVFPTNPPPPTNLAPPRHDNKMMPTYHLPLPRFTSHRAAAVLIKLSPTVCPPAQSPAVASSSIEPTTQHWQ